ncbi:lysophosphatidic acid receptor 6-like [Paralichthys olivaceus]|uniref:lysophosphatidic acid receptor 6-like n=1 Tax=Paralichthys olivaceus TaxID=8255 RepID=UPI00375301A1
MSTYTMQHNGTTPERNTVYALIYGSVMVLGLPLNVLSLWILLRYHSFTAPSIVFMVNLAISDLLLVISLPMRVYFHATGTWPLRSFACIFITMLFHNNIRSSSIFITFISMDRLLAVVYPLRSRHLRTLANAWKAVLLIWLFVLVLNVPESVLFSKSLNRINETNCFEFSYIPNPSVTPISFVHTALVLTLLTVNIVCTALVSWTLRRHLNESARVNNKVNVMVIFVMNLLMFTIFFLPVSLVVLFGSERHYRTPLVCLASMNCCLDPLLYYFSLDGFWKKKEDVEISLARE